MQSITICVLKWIVCWKYQHAHFTIDTNHVMALLVISLCLFHSSVNRECWKLIYIWEIQLVTLVIHHASLVLLGIVADIKLHVNSKREEYLNLISCSDYHSLAWILSSIVNIYFSHAILKRTVLSKLW